MPGPFLCLDQLIERLCIGSSILLQSTLDGLEWLILLNLNQQVVNLINDVLRFLHFGRLILGRVGEGIGSLLKVLDDIVGQNGGPAIDGRDVGKRGARLG